LGYEVNIACYSKHLVERDRSAFESFFKLFRFDRGQLTYGSIQDLAEGFINRKGEVRDSITEMMRPAAPVLPTPPAATPSPARGGRRSASPEPILPKILILDEVDTFLQPHFYTEAHSINARLVHPTIADLITWIWLNKPMSFSQVAETTEYHNCIAQFTQWTFWIEFAVKDMLRSLRTVTENKAKPYEFDRRNRIGYKVDDAISEKLNYGYQTIFSYFKEYEARHLSLDIVRENFTYISVNAGEYLYNQLLTEYAGIFGDSGTLTDLIPQQKLKLRALLRIDVESYIPSAYGTRRTRFYFQGNSAQYLKIIDTEAAYRTDLLNEILERMKDIRGTASASPVKRAVIVFFEDEAKLKRFNDFIINHESFLRSGYSIQRMLEKDDTSERNRAILKAVKSGTVTLAVKDFGRGTDYVCYDPELNEAGGVHIIQSGFSDEKSEETQIQGRTARNSNYGSYSMVLLASELKQQFQLTDAQITELKPPASDPYDQLQRYRTAACTQRVASMQSSPELQTIHDQSTLLRGVEDISIVRQYLEGVVRRQVAFTAKRVVFAIDYSTSMTGTKITSAVSNLQNIFNRYVYDSDQLALIQFASRVNTLLPITPKTGNETRIRNTIATLTTPDGTTMLYDAIDLSAGLLVPPPPAAAPVTPANTAGSPTTEVSNDWVVILTDGEDVGSRTSLDTLCTRLQARSATLGIIVIGIQISTEAGAVLRRIAECSARGVYVTADGDRSSIDRAFNRAAEIMESHASYNR
jgi:Mg-chelatase subunit ChlD